MAGVIGIGIDIVAVERVREALATYGDRLLRRLFSNAELALLAERKLDGARLAEYVAGRFAAKEATAKATRVGIGALGWRNVEIMPDGRGAPLCHLRGRAGQLAATRGVGHVELSITHAGGTAAACAVALQRCPEPPAKPEVV